MSYLLGDNEIASRRLKLLAEIFAPATEALLAGARSFRPPARPELALDLGCGPGHTTRLLAKTLDPVATIGIDSSESFIAEAAGARPARGVSFLRHDILQAPFPTGLADLVFGRYILMHLGEPQQAVNRWLTQLKPGGLLLLEELERLEPEEPLFQQYVTLLERSLALQEKTMFIGPAIAAAKFPDAAFRLNRVQEIKVSVRDAARLFSMNMHTLKDSPQVRALYGEQEIGEFIGGLTRLAGEQDTSRAPVVWQLRQMVLQRV